MLLSALVATYVFLRWLPRIRVAGAFAGGGMVVLGLWVGAVGQIAHLWGLLLDPSAGGAAAAGHGGVFWVTGIVSVILIVTGLIWLIARVLHQFETQARMRTEAEQREARLKQAADMAKLGFYIYDPAAERIIYCTEQHAASHGLSVPDYLGQASTLSNGMPLIHPDDREMAREKYQSVAAGRMAELEYRVPTAAGLRWVREVAMPEMDAAGRVVREFGISQDITEQRKLQSLLHSRVRMEAVGNLTGGIAHDFNNLLAVILGNLELALEAEGKSEDLLDEAIAATLRGAELTKAMLSFARRAPLEPSVLDLNRIVQRAQIWAERSLPPGIEVESRLATGLWPVKADRGATESALLNLIVNARDAMGQTGRLVLETGNIRADAAHPADDLAPGRYVALSVSDTGAGIAPENLDRIFEPFFSTKGPAKGSGLGLSMIQGFMKQSQGSVEVLSEPGGGATFRLYFPALAAEAPATVEPPTAPAEPAWAEQGQTLLVVEDEPAVMSVLVRSLTGAGYEVLQAATGDAALERFGSADGVDLVLTDIVMPGTLQGPALVRELRRARPDLPAVFLSGFADEELRNGHGVGKGDIRLMKPVSRAELLAAVSQTLSRHGGQGQQPPRGA